MTTDTDSGEANTVTPVTERAKPELVMIGNRQIISNGCWNDGLVADWLLLESNRIRWVQLGEVAKVAWGANNIRNKERARRYLSRLWRYLLVERGVLLVVKYAVEKYHATQAVKVYDPASADEREMVETRLDRMSRNKELTEERYQLALNLLHPTQGQLSL